MKLTPSQLQKYDKSGYVVIDCPFSNKLSEDCLRAVDKMATDPVSPEFDTQGNHFRLAPQFPGSFWCGLDHSLPFLQVILHAEILELARQMADDEDIYLRNGGINELGPNNSFWWHRDSDDNYTEFMHYFTGATMQNGCLRVIPGSHLGSIGHLNDEVLKKRREQKYPVEHHAEGWKDVELPGEIPIEIQPDQLLVRSSLIYHSTSLNSTADGRLMSHWLFRSARFDDHRFRFENVLTPELLEKLSQEQKMPLWLERDFQISKAYREEQEKEKLTWGVI